MIYFVHQRTGGPIKIGASAAPEARRASLQTWFPYPIEIIATLEGGRIGETFLHRCFWPLATAPEWFEPSPSIWRFLLDVIDNGRPSFLPAEERMASEELEAIALDIFGCRKRAAQSLGYKPTTSVRSIFAVTSDNSYALQSRLLFRKYLRDGLLPSYIADLHHQAVPITEAAE